MASSSHPAQARLVPFARALAVAVALGGCGGDPDAGTVVERPPETGAAAVRGAEPSVQVDVSGHVRRPGVYRLAADARVHEAIRAAGGVRSGAQLVGINRAAVLVDGQQVLVPSSVGPAAGGGGPPGGGTGAADAAGARVSLSSADAAALDALPGIGPVTAERIVADRAEHGPFAGVDDLDRVPGIGPSTVAALRDVVSP